MTNVGSSVGEPRREFFVRIDPNDLVGPLAFQHANARARFLSSYYLCWGPTWRCSEVGLQSFNSKKFLGL